jgi:alpha-amylase
MPNVCLYFQLHQPYRLHNYSVFEIGKKNRNYFAGQKRDENRQVFEKVAQKSYLPMLSLLEELVKQEEGFNCTLSLSGIFLEQAESFAPEVVNKIRRLVESGKVELLSETYYHSLASLYSRREFRHQVFQHRAAMKHYFGVEPKVFRNTELIYSNHVANEVEALGFDGMLTEAVDRYLHGRARTQLFAGLTHQRLPLLLKHAPLSDDIAFRFSDRNWQWHPLSVEQYLRWVEIYPENEVINLFMDFETFGEHQWEDTGIFEFFRVFVRRFLEKDWNRFVTPSALFAAISEPDTRHDGYLGKNISPAAKDLREQLPIYDVPEPISWADVDRDLTAWRDNALQHDTLRLIYDLEEKVLATKNERLINDWRKLQTSDHFYYMCTKWSADGDVHAYFSPYKTPHEAYRRYAIVLADLQERLI